MVLLNYNFIFTHVIMGGTNRILPCSPEWTTLLIVCISWNYGSIRIMEAHVWKYMVKSTHVEVATRVEHDKPVNV